MRVEEGVGEGMQREEYYTRGKQISDSQGQDIFASRFFSLSQP